MRSTNRLPLSDLHLASRDANDANAEREPRRPAQSERSELADLVDTMADALDRGETFDIDALTAKHPDLDRPLRAAHQSLVGLREMAEAAATLGDPSSPQAAATRQVTLGDFRILREIGHGGMGVVYESEQISLGRRVAIKVLPFASMLDQRQLTRFKNEARAAAMLKHPNIVNVHSVGCDRSVHFYAMELIEGASLAEVIEELRVESEVSRDGRELVSHDAKAERGPRQQPSSKSPFPIPNSPSSSPHSPSDTEVAYALSTQRTTNPKRYFHRVAELGIQAARALHYAHQEGVVHRDIKPSNLMLDGDGNIHITDFGLARIASDTSMTMTGDLVGTLRYMSPEQLDDDSLVDQRTDVYSLGLTLYELTTGHPAFESNGREQLILQVKEATPLPPSRHERAVPRDLETIILKAIEKEPTDRYFSCADFADDLARFSSDQPIRAKPPTPMQRLAKWSRRHRQLVATTVLATVAISIIAIVSALVVTRSEWRRLRDVATAQRAVQAEQQFKHRRVQYATDITLAAQMWRIGYDDVARRHLDRHAAMEDDIDLRGFEWHLLNQTLRPLDNACLRTVSAHTGDIYGVAVSSEGKLIATASKDGTAKLFNAATLEQLAVIDAGGGEVNHVDFSPDGQLLATAHDDAIVRVWDVATTEQIATLQGHQPIAIGVEFSSDGRWLATCDDQHTTILWSTQSWESVGQVPGYATAFSPDSKLLVTATEETVTLWAIPKLMQIRQRLKTHGGVMWIEFLNESVFACATTRRRVFFWDAQSGENFPRINRASGGVVESITYAGNVLAVAGKDGLLRIWDVEASSPGNHNLRSILPALVGRSGRLWSAAFSPDGKWLYSAGSDGVLRVWNPYMQSTPIVWQPKSNVVWSVAFSPDGQFLLAGCDDGVIRCLSRNSHRQTGEWPTHQPGPTRLTFSRDGETLASAGQNVVLRRGAPLAQAEQHAIPVDLVNVRTDAMLALSPDGDTLAVANETSDLSLWDVASNTQLPGFPRLVSHDPVSPHAVAFSADGESIYVGNSQYLLVGDLATRRWTSILDGHVFIIIGVDVSPDGSTVVTYGADKTIKLWNARTLQDRATLVYEHAGIYAGAISPDGKTLATCGRDGHVVLWNVATGSQLLRIHPQPNCMQLFSVAFAPDGSALAAGGQTEDYRAAVYIWELDREDEDFATRRAVPRQAMAGVSPTNGNVLPP